MPWQITAAMVIAGVSLISFFGTLMYLAAQQDEVDVQRRRAMVDALFEAPEFSWILARFPKGWIDDNSTWLWKDKDMMHLANTISKQLVQNGIPFGTASYFKILDGRMYPYLVERGYRKDT
jgi:hypothetical protein